MKQITLYKSTTVCLSSAGEYELILKKPDIEVAVYGAWRLNNQENMKIKLQVTHDAPHTKSQITLRGVADQQADLQFAGTIVVRPKAQQVNAFLSANILLLSPLARATVHPNLEIEADDVRCSHASTVSDISEEQLFYLQSRGIPQKQAKELIIDGFLEIAHCDQPDIKL